MRASPIAILALAFMAAHAFAADSDWNLCAFATDYDQRIAAVHEISRLQGSRDCTRARDYRTAPDTHDDASRPCLRFHTSSRRLFL